jgi:hypothetical protein
MTVVERAQEDPRVGPQLHRRWERPAAANAATVVAAGAPAQHRLVGGTMLCLMYIALHLLLTWVLGEVLALQHVVT